MSGRFLVLTMVNWLRLTALERCVEKDSEAQSSFFGKERGDHPAASSKNGREGIGVRTPPTNHEKDNRGDM